MSLLKDSVDLGRDEYYDVLASETDGNRGLLIWMKELIEDSVRTDWDGNVFVGAREWTKMRTRGIFPSIMVIPLNDPWEVASTSENLHTVEVNVVSAVRGKRDYTFWKAIEYASELHDLFKMNVPEHDIFRKKPSEGEIQYAWEYLENEWLGVSRLGLSYECQLSIL